MVHVPPRAGTRAPAVCPGRMKTARLLLAAAAAWIGSAHAADVTVNPAVSHQTIEGFGTCLISWGNYPRQTYTDAFARFYTQTVGLNMLRIALSDFQHDEVQDPSAITARGIRPDERARVFVDFARRLNATGADIRYIGTVWTPPVWMKLNRLDGNGTREPGREGRNRAIRADSYRYSNAADGVSTNRVDPAKYPHFVAWLVALATWHKDNGMPLYGLSLANEPRFSQWYGSCVWTAEDYATVLALLGPALRAAGLEDIHLFGPEDMTGHTYPGGTGDMVRAIAANPAALAALDRWATHGYTDGVAMDTSSNSSLQFWELVRGYGKPYWMTEGGTGGHDWPAPVRDGLGIALHNSLVHGNASAFVPWQISEARPSMHAIAVRDQVTPKTAAGMQFFRTIPPGSVRIGATPEADGDLRVSAFRTPQGGLTVVALNTGTRAQSLSVRVEGPRTPARWTVRRTTATDRFAEQPAVAARNGVATLELPPHSIVTLQSTGS